MFKLEKCAIPTVWCGESDTVPKSKDPLIKYKRAGTRDECLKKGFGAGSNQARLKTLPRNSLQRIKYLGEIHESRFIEKGIKNTDVLLKEMSGRSTTSIAAFLKSVLTKKDKKVDIRTYNCVLVFLHQNGISNLPSCVTIK